MSLRIVDLPWLPPAPADTAPGCRLLLLPALPPLPLGLRPTGGTQARLRSASIRLLRD